MPRRGKGKSIIKDGFPAGIVPPFSPQHTLQTSLKQQHKIMSNTHFLVLLGALVLAQIVAATTSGAAITFKQCVQLEVPVPVVAINQNYSMPRVDSNIDAIDWTVNFTTWSTTPHIFNSVNINNTFTISAQLCVPSQKGPKADILQIATHGLGFDKMWVVLSFEMLELSNKGAE